jgi:hypothetical protein
MQAKKCKKLEFFKDEAWLTCSRNTNCQTTDTNNLHGYTVHQWYQTLWCPTNAHNIKNVELLKHFNPLPALTVQSGRDLNVPCRHKRSMALLLTQKNRIFFKEEDVFTFRTKTLNPLAVRLKVLLHALTGCVFSVAYNSRTTPETGLPSRKKKIIIKLKKTEW